MLYIINNDYYINCIIYLDMIYQQIFSHTMDTKKKKKTSSSYPVLLYWQKNWQSPLHWLLLLGIVNFWL